MLQLKNITKSYTTGDFTQVALDGISLSFRKSEFVAILGHSGSGKTTCLNVIGGLDKYDGGDLIINGKSSKHFKSKDWDAYRNNSVGFIFQSYNLISHLNIIDNVEMGMTLSGVSKSKRHEKALEVLERVGLKDHLHKKPNQLSGGQMQRVAIARALANDPDIILADEPTGALDTATSKQIMELIKEIADDKLVIMVTHNPDLAEQYADRIVKFKDGRVIDDSNPYDETPENKEYSLKKTSMSFLTALKLSGKNIWTKKGRTTLTSFASSLGIIGIALILALSSGFQKQIIKFQSEALSEFPIIISQQSRDIDEDDIEEMSKTLEQRMNQNTEFTDTDSVILYSKKDNTMMHQNNLSDEYIEYVENIDPKICSSIGYTRITGMNILRKNDEGKAMPASFSVGISGVGGSDAYSSPSMGAINSMSSLGLTSYPESLNGKSDNYLEKNYNILAGSYPKSETELVLVVDSKNRVDTEAMSALGFDTDGIDKIDFDDIIGTEMKIISNNTYYEKNKMGIYMPKTDYDEMYNDGDNITLKITGVVRIKEDATIGMLASGIAYSDFLTDRVIELNKNSDIVKAQQDSDKNVMTNEKLDSDSKEQILAYLGADSSPSLIYIYPNTFDDKNEIIGYLDKYNEGKRDEDVIAYTDLADTMTSMTGSIMDAITLVLIAFAAISLIVSLIMVAIITYISVIERTKEIGVLRALGARKKDISRVFNAETFIIGVCSGLLGIGTAYLLCIPTNSILENMTDLANVAQLNPIYAIVLVTISVALTLLGGLIPARMAAKKDPVEALRSE